VMLGRGGALVIENHYLLDILERNQFDSIYHEHVRTYTLKSLVTLFAQYGMEVFDVERVPRYGGNIRVYVGRIGSYVPTAAVGELLTLEASLDWSRRARAFTDNVLLQRDIMRTFLGATHNVVACSAPGRATTLLNFFGVTRDDVIWTGEIDGSLKIGKHIPGCRIPVVSNRRLVEDRPYAVVLLAWHYGKEIAARLRREGVESRLFVPLPTFAEVT
jgi:hypothetical protein